MTADPLIRWDQAIVDERKLLEYCLSPVHHKGRHKARVFAAALGFTQADAGDLQRELLWAARREAPVFEKADQYGRRYRIEFRIHGVLIRSSWMVRAGEQAPRFLTCYVVREGKYETPD